MVLFVTAAVWVAYPGRRRAAPGIASLAAGVLIGMAACYKPVALVFAPVPLVADWLEGSPGRGRRIAWFGAGLAVAPAAIITWLAAHGLVGEAWTAVVEYNRAYLTSQTSVMALADRFAHELVRRAKTEPLWALAILASPVGVWHIVRTRALDLLFVTALAWWGLATLGAAASGIRLFNSYFIPSHPAMAVLAGGLLAGAWTRTVAGRRALLLTAIGIAVFVCWRGGVFGRTLAITRLDAQAWWSGQSASPTYLERFGGYATGRGYSARANAELADRIQTETGPGDRVYIFGMAPSVYFMAQRLPSNRFLWVYPPVSGLVSRQGFNRASFAADLSRSAPTLFIFERNNRDSRTGWRVETDFASGPVQAFLRPYSHLVDIEDFEVFRHR